MARSLSATLLTAQQGAKRKPYVRIVINSIDYSSRVLFVEHHEEPYRDWATIVLDNSDRGLDAVSTLSTNLLGYRFRIGYGYVSTAGNEYSESADLWVKSQQIVSSEGQLVCQLYCEGQWAYLREQRVMALLDKFAIADPAEVGSDPYYTDTISTKTVYELIESVLENAFTWTLNAAPTTDDGILTSFKPVFSLAQLPYAASVLRDLIQMTECYLRPKANLIWEILFPQDADAIDETFYSDKKPFFTEYSEAISLVIPNKIVVFAGNPDGLPVWPTPVIVGETADYSGNYVEVLEPNLAPTIITAADAGNRADAILARYQAEQLAGYLIAPHDCRVELYDKVSVEDMRGY